MIAVAQGKTVMLIGGGRGNYAITRLKYLLLEMEKEISMEAILVELDDLALRRGDIPLGVIRVMKQAYIEKIRECWFVPLDLFKTHITQRFTRYIRKIPVGFDRKVNKRKTFLKSLA